MATMLIALRSYGNVRIDRSFLADVEPILSRVVSVSGGLALICREWRRKSRTRCFGEGRTSDKTCNKTRSALCVIQNRRSLRASMQRSVRTWSKL